MANIFKEGPGAVNQRLYEISWLYDMSQRQGTFKVNYAKFWWIPLYQDTALTVY